MLKTQLSIKGQENSRIRLCFITDMLKMKNVLRQ
jgi:hypothetical protein